MRDGIGKSERHEINCALLLPMRQAIHRETDVCVRIEEVQFGPQRSQNKREEALWKDASP
jgi:hypothetical protein